MNYNEEDLMIAADEMLDQLGELRGLREERQQVAKALEMLIDNVTWQQVDTVASPGRCRRLNRSWPDVPAR